MDSRTVYCVFLFEARLFPRLRLASSLFERPKTLTVHGRRVGVIYVRLELHYTDPSFENHIDYNSAHVYNLSVVMRITKASITYLWETLVSESSITALVQKTSATELQLYIDLLISTAVLYQAQMKYLRVYYSKLTAVSSGCMFISATLFL